MTAPHDVAAWLDQIGLSEYAPIFAEHAIDREVLADLDDQDLRELGVPLGHRKKLLKAIAALRAPTQEAAGGGEAGARGAPPREAERRQLSVLFVDLVGSTELSARLDPEDMAAVIRGYQACCAGVVERWGGHVAKYMGDGVLAYFGWPVAHEDEAERAIRAGLELVGAVHALDAPGLASGGGCGGGQVGRLGEPEVKPDVPLASAAERRVRRTGPQTPSDHSTRATNADPGAGRPLAARIGIATGLVMVGELIGKGAAQEQTVVGETPNLAARLQTLAAPGGIVISQTTRRLVGGLFELADLGPLRLKGFAEPLAAWRVDGEGRAEGRFEARQTAGLTPLVGRDEELALLLRRWQQAQDGEGHVVLMSGEPGIGKSRLVREVRARLESEPHVRLLYQCSPHHTTSPLHPLIEQLERAAGLAAGDRAEAKLDKLAALLARGTDRLDQAVPLIAALLGVPTEGRWPALDLTPQRQKQLTLAALVEQLEGLAAAQPVLLAYEDAHWSDPTTQELLGLTIERVARLPVLLLITFRPEFGPPWPAQPHLSALALSRLGRREGAALVERVVKDKPLPAEVAAQIVAKTDGVPLFVEELTKTVLESGLLKDAGDRYELAGPLPPLALPSTLHDSLLARLDRLAPIKEVAQIGAALGREFSHALLAAVADRSCRPRSTSWSRPSWSTAAAPRPMSSTASSTRWSRTPPTAPCSSPAASTSMRASPRSWRPSSRRSSKPSPNSSRNTTPARVSRNKRSSTGTRLANAPFKVRPTRRRSSASRRRWSCLQRCRRPPSACGESWPCRHALARLCTPSRALRRRMPGPFTTGRTSCARGSRIAHSCCSRRCVASGSSTSLARGMMRRASWQAKCSLWPRRNRALRSI
jgi:class 3 adenylate cyclase